MMRTFWLILFSVSAVLGIPVDSRVPGGVAVLQVGHKNGSAPQVFFREKRLPVVYDNEQGWVAIAGLPLSLKNGEFSVRIEQGGQTWQKPFVTRDKKYEEQHITLKDNSKVTPSKKDLERIWREKKQITNALGEFRAWRLPDLEFIPPVTGRISGTFGLKRFYNNQPRSPHKGLDLAVERGTPIKSVSSGRVALTGDFFFNGKTVIVEHGQGVFTMYCHLDSINVHQGDSVEQADIIGSVGSTGRSTGPHLHFGVRIAEAWVDPSLFLEKR